MPAWEIPGDCARSLCCKLAQWRGLGERLPRAAWGSWNNNNANNLCAAYRNNNNPDNKNNNNGFRVVCGPRYMDKPEFRHGNDRERANSIYGPVPGPEHYSSSGRMVKTGGGIAEMRAAAFFPPRGGR